MRGSVMSSLMREAPRSTASRYESVLRYQGALLRIAAVGKAESVGLRKCDCRRGRRRESLRRPYLNVGSTCLFLHTMARSLSSAWIKRCRICVTLPRTRTESDGAGAERGGTAERRTDTWQTPEHCYRLRALPPRCFSCGSSNLHPILGRTSSSVGQHSRPCRRSLA